MRADENALVIRFLQAHCRHALFLSLPDEVTSEWEHTQVLRCTNCGKRAAPTIRRPETKEN